MNLFEKILYGLGGGGSGGGSDVLNENGVIKQEHLPDGYPYEEKGQVLILENDRVGGGPACGAKEGYGDKVNDVPDILGVAAMVVGDTYTINVDGVDYTGVCEYCADSSSEGGNGIQMFTHGEIPYAFDEAPVVLTCYNNGVYIDFEDGGAHSVKIYHHVTDIETIDPKYLPTAEAIADAAGDTVTGAEFNALLASLRAAGLLKS